MNKFSHYNGIDISKDVFDVMDEQGAHYQHENDLSGFKKFESAKQFTCYIGLSPVEKQSGTSVKGSSHISKQGNGKLRNLVFLCSFNACKSNKACEALYQRIVAKGKSKKLTLIAVANELLKQAFAIAKSGLVYDAEYRNIKPCLN